MTELIKIGDATFSRPGASTTIKDGALTSLANNEPAFEAGGLRSYGQVTNIHANSADASQGLLYTRMTPTYSSSADVLGANVALCARNTAGAAYVYRQSSVYATGVVTLSCFAKAGTFDQCSLDFPQVVTGQAVLQRAVFSLSLGSVVSVTANATAGITQVPNGWYRIWITTSVTSQPAANHIFFNNTSPDASTGSVWFGGLQINAGGIAPYIPTSGTAATSPKENCTIPAPPELSGSAWSIVATVTPRAIESGYSGSILASNPTNGLNIYIDDSGALFCEAGGVTSSIAAGFANNVAKRFVITKSGNNYTINVAGVSGSFVGGALSVDSLTYIGSDANGSWQFNGNINDIRFYSKALSPSEIAGILA